MKPNLNRRDFIKLTGLLSLGAAVPQLMKIGAPGNERPNVLVIVFDAFSAYHISLHGYQRETMPNLVRLAERAVVYHNHHAGGSFTTPGTASLLTGTLPWSHRAFQPAATVADPYVTQNIFSALPDYYRIAYTHNGWANIFLKQFSDVIDELVPWESLFLRSFGSSIPAIFDGDLDTASVAWARDIKVRDQGYAYSLFLSNIYEELQQKQFAKIRGQFPRGLPSTGNGDNHFLIEDAVNWITKRLPQIPRPFLGYFHFLPPHGPYNTSLEFFQKFANDGYKPIDKPLDIFSEGVTPEKILKKRMEYDEFLLYVDREFARLFNALESSGLLENTWLIFTSDHGEVFERGMDGHSSDALYQPQIRVPLLIFEPGRTNRMDITVPTSAVDVLPTISHITGHRLPAWTEGIILPPYAESNPDPDRNIYTMKAARNDKYAPITHATTVLVKGRYKLLYYFGDVERGIDELVKLYDIQDDPEELNNLYPSRKDTAAELLHELKSKLAKVNEPYL